MRTLANPRDKRGTPSPDLDLPIVEISDLLSSTTMLEAALAFLISCR